MQAGPLTLSTLEGEVRFFDGTCFASPRTDLVGCDLVGWLEELDDLSGVGAWWRPGLRAVLRSPDGRPAVSAGSHDLSIGGLLAASGFATHTARFLVARGDQPSTPLPSPSSRASEARAAAETIPVELASGIRPAIPRPRDTDTALRARGEWRATGLVPWTLGEGKPPPALTQPAISASGARTVEIRPKPRSLTDFFFRRAAS